MAPTLDAVSTLDNGDFLLQLSTSSQRLRASRAQLAKIYASFDVLDRVAPHFRMDDRVSVDVALPPAAAAAPAELPALQRCRLSCCDSLLEWELGWQQAGQWCSARLAIDSLLKFQPAVLCHAAVLINTTDMAAARQALEQRLSGDALVLGLGNISAKVGFVDEHQFARTIDLVRSTGLEACKLSFEVVLKIDSLEQAGRAAAAQLLEGALSRGASAQSVQIIGMEKPSHCSLVVEHRDDPSGVFFSSPTAAPATA